MKTLTDQLSQYGAYHRDRRNLVTHLFGIPMIVVGVTTLLARASVEVSGVPISLAAVAGIASIGYYLALDLRFGVAMGVAIGAAVVGGTALARLPTAAWLAWGIGLFVFGWVIQFIGHRYEGRKPAFADDLIGLLIGPLFIVAEVAFMAGLRREVEAAIAERIGPMRAGAPSADGSRG